ncbi:MAG: nucleotidyltransferase domain-containing protein [Planctomycetota bacterium]
MHRADVFTIFTGRLEAAEIEYFVTGSVASIIYGEPRMTHDIDLVIDCGESDIDDLLDAFPEEGFYRPRQVRFRSDH